jgi:membrane protein implicated in regulation of membrane protease activity
MTWWAWMILGAVLFGAELLAIDAQFYLVFLGVSAALVGLLELFGLDAPEWAEWLVFAALALVSMFTFRRSLYQKMRGGAPGFRQGVSGEYVTVPAGLDAGAQGRASFRGSEWTVVNQGATPIPAGARARILRNDGLTLYVSADPGANGSP